MSEFFANFHFLRPIWLLLIPVAVAIWWFWHRGQMPLRGWRQQIDKDFLDVLTIDDGPRGFQTHHLWMVCWLLMSVAIAGPTWRLEPTPFAEDTVPLIVILKADASMDRPFPPPSRIERAHLKLQDLAERREGQPMGLIVYAGSAHLVLPPTKDTAIVGEMAAEIDSSVMPKGGDRLDLAIRKAGELIERGGAGGSVLIVADSVECDPIALKEAHQASGRFAVQFLSLTPSDSSDSETIRDAAKALGGTIRQLSVDDEDIEAIARASSRSAAGASGDSDRWQESGYWLTFLIAIAIVTSFRKHGRSYGEEQ